MADSSREDLESSRGSSNNEKMQVCHQPTKFFIAVMFCYILIQWLFFHANEGNSMNPYITQHFPEKKKKFTLDSSETIQQKHCQFFLGYLCT